MLFDEVFGDPEFNPEKCFVSSKATVIGRVIMEEEVIVAPGASIRADEGTPFKICRGTNVQDKVTMHGLLDQFVEEGGKKFSIWIGSHCSIAHDATIHGPAKVGKHSFVGFDAKVLFSTVGRNCCVDHDAKVINAVVGSNCYIGVGAIVRDCTIGDGRFVPDGAIVNCPALADALPMFTKEQRDKKNHFNQEVVDYNKKKLLPLYRERRKKKREAARKKKQETAKKK